MGGWAGQPVTKRRPDFGGRPGGKSFSSPSSLDRSRRKKRELLLSWKRGINCSYVFGSQLLHAGIRKRLYAVFFHHTSNLNQKSGKPVPPTPKIPLLMSLKLNLLLQHTLPLMHCRANQPSPASSASVLSRKCKQRTTPHSPGSCERKSRGNTCQST